ncbi:MAG: hypothetical protein KKG47_07075 [Proteobacteria bacterium]|nr:hypothetical protein [Pseudomonadota bacterium]MBU1739168.1 hypothetical protein [Pseudomonadota bacterium]
MKKQEVRIVVLALGLGLFLWLVDSLLDFYFFYEGSFITLLISDVPEHELYIRILIILCFLGFGLVAASLISRLRKKETEQAELIGDLRRALDEIKALKGILPICSFCKQIRDDKGYWNQVEVYIRNHTDADFSHSICPECTRKHYPEYFEEKDTSP